MAIAPAEIVSRLIRFDTTNPPGNERECLLYARGLLLDAGIEGRLIASDQARPNLVARISGRGEASPLLLYGHVDVVTVAGQRWSRAPFGGEEADGFIWGRGALDMKGGVAMMLAALLRIAASGRRPPGDVVLALLADEEDGGKVGARFLVDQHPDVFAGVRFALGELGGFSLTVAGRRLYPVMVSEKQACWVRIRLRGPGGHASLRHHGGAMASLGSVLRTLDRKRLPVHVTPPVRAMIEAMAAALPGPRGVLVRRLLSPALTDRVLGLMGADGRLLDSLLHNTVNATIVAGGQKLNVIPSELTLELDGRILPGLGPDLLVQELTALLGAAAEVEVVGFLPGPSKLDLAYFPTLAAILREADPGAAPIPYVLPAVTDASHLARLGIQTYGFLPMRLPEGFDFSATIHAADERIPVAAMEFGTSAMQEAILRYHL